VSENDDLFIYGKGFAGFFMDNRVYFIDAKDKVVEAEVEIGDESYLKVMVPEGLSPGPLKVYVELKDNSRSNEKALAMRPKMVVADPESGTHFEDELDVWLFQEQNYDIYYSIDSGSVKKYAGPITLNQGAHIYPFARAAVDGVNYDSVTGDFFYYKCSAGEELIDGECVADTGTDELSVTVKYTLPSADSPRDNNDYVLDTFQAGPRSLVWSNTDQMWVDEKLGYTYARIRLDPDTNQVSGFVHGLDSSQVGGIQFDNVPAIGNNKFAVYGKAACGHSAMASPVPGYEYYHGSCHESLAASASAAIEVICTGSIAAP
jgi:hypothetical protein